ncbi:hypothetical protein BKA66DRAFT_242174 [Pyrenochaeta sp. MPI-SDFR-AT-0127]|nr:hypothetical protein BKA66DRAFT_242174 [Pyrenochaeta sp. MPI-SDFR-AT-0127]
MTMISSIIEILPEELLDRILFFTSHRATRCALCLVSKDINRIATPHLYANIYLQEDDFQYLRPLAFLLWTSAKHRDAVKSFSVRRAYGGNLDPWPNHQNLETIIRAQIKLYVRGGEADQWLFRVRDGADPLPIASLLLRSLKNVAMMQFDGFQLVDPSSRGG